MSDDIISYSTDNQRLVAGEPLPEDRDTEILSLRPERLADPGENTGCRAGRQPGRDTQNTPQVDGGIQGTGIETL